MRTLLLALTAAWLLITAIAAAHPHPPSVPPSCHQPGCKGDQP